ncbi:MAG: TraR/DksA C4-type zinc finger protein [Acidimicrobiales bacterium]
MDEADVRQHLDEERTRLAGLRDEFVEAGLTTQSEGDSLSELSSADQHQADVGTETFDRERDLSIYEQVEAELADVEHALQRLGEGTYGTCEACGRSIDEGRLEAVPAARLCLEDQAVAEREARSPTAR